MINGMRHVVMTDRERKMLNRINRRIARSTRWNRTKYRLLHPFLKLMPAREIVWRDTYGGSYPACPRCGEMVYYIDMCCFCGQRLKDNTKTIGGVLDERGD